ncbi:MAG TPA: PPC domain-containing protein [Pirellulales bacterium]|nr:PPC domain-containing protein [Pirellulales bacterium]
MTQAAGPEVKHLFPAGASRGSTVEVTAAGNFAKWPAQAWVDRPDVSVVAAADKGKFSVVVTPDAAPGVRWIRVFDTEGASAPLPFVVGALPEVNEQEPNDSPKKPQALPGPACVVNGRLEKRGDVDTFAVPLVKGQTLVAALTANQTLGSPMDGVLQVVSARGSVLAQCDDERGLDPLLAFTAPADGAYLVRVFAFPSTADASIAFAGGERFIYRLTVTTGGFIDGALPLSVSRGSQTEVAAYGWNLTDADHRRQVEPPAGSSETFLFSPHWANGLTVPVVEHRSIVESEPNDAGHPQAVELPVTFSGRIGELHDKDAIRLHLGKGQAWQFKVDSRSLGYPLDGVLELFDSAGKSLVRADDAGKDLDPEIKFTAPADGEFTLVVSDLYEHGGPRYFYRLTIAPLEADFALTVGQHSYVLAVGKPLEIPVTIDRRQNFAGDIELQVLGLPEGVTVSPARSIAKDDTAKSVKLTFTATAGPFSGVIRIAGSSKEGVERLRLAESNVVAGAHISDLWLTVTP